jgi:signal transduction histidine kinase
LVAEGPRLRFYAGALIRTAQGHALGTVCVMDSRARKLDDEQRRVLRALARQAMTQLELRRTMIVAARAHRYRGRLMAIAGHDLKQPLTTMTMVLDMLPAATPADRRRIEVAKAAAARLREELDGLSRASRLEEDTDAVELEPLQVDELIAEVADTWLRAARDKGLGLQVRVIDAEVRTHAGMLRTMLDNLVGNAIKYTSQGSVTIACREEGGDLWIDVTDTGKGIPEGRRDEMFTAFRQLDPDTDGLGLGLSIVKSTADMLGYRLSLECGEGRGATFSVCLPGQAPGTARAPR